MMDLSSYLLVDSVFGSAAGNAMTLAAKLTGRVPDIA
jgi:hypothetical protein